MNVVGPGLCPEMLLSLSNRRVGTVKTSFADTVIIQMIISVIGLAVVIFTLTFELSVPWTMLILGASFAALWFLLKIRKKA